MRQLPPKGTRDFLPDQLNFRHHVLDSIVKVYRQAGFRQIETPCIENIELLLGNQGGENEKMVYKILKRGEKLKASLQTKKALADLGLRFDLTLPLCRFYANNQNNLPKPAKLIQIGQVWRAERPQQGRFRQFLQCDIDIIGLEAPLAELDLIATTTEALLALGLKEFTVHINDRSILNALLDTCGFDPNNQIQILVSLDKLDKINWAGVKHELIKTDQPLASIDKLEDLITKSLSFEDLIQVLQVDHPKLDQSQKNINSILKTFSDTQDFKVKFNLSLVRGMGYYTGLIFEIRTTDQESSIAGGGRYDKLIANILSKHENILAVGFSIGLERLLHILEQKHTLQLNSDKNLALLYKLDSQVDLKDLIQTARKLKPDYKEVSLLPLKTKLSRQLSRLVQDKFTHYAIFKTTNINIKTLKTDKPR